MADQMTGLFSPFLRRRRLAAVGPHLGEGRVLDYGCGVGELAGGVSPARYLGVDLDAESIAAARERHPAHRFQTLAEFEADGAAGDFDVIAALALIEHLPEPGRWLAGLRGRLGPAGKVVLTTPHPSLRRAHELGARLRLFSREAADEHEAMLDRRALQAAAAEAGLRLAEYRRFLFGCNQLAVLRAEGEGTP